MIFRWSGESQVKIKSQEFSRLYICEHETCKILKSFITYQKNTYTKSEPEVCYCYYVPVWTMQDRVYFYISPLNCAVQTLGESYRLHFLLQGLNTANSTLYQHTLGCNHCSTNPKYPTEFC